MKSVAEPLAAAAAAAGLPGVASTKAATVDAESRATAGTRAEVVQVAGGVARSWPSNLDCHFAA